MRLDNNLAVAADTSLPTTFWRAQQLRGVSQVHWLLNSFSGETNINRVGNEIMAVGKSVQRVDGVAKVTGKARYTDDFTMPGMRVAKYLRSTISHGRVLAIDTSNARTLPGVDGVFTSKDVPKNVFATAGHPFSMDPGHVDVADRLLLTDHVRYMGDEIAIVVADSELTASKALALIEVEYETYQPLVDHQDILDGDAPEIHKGTGNVVKAHSFVAGGNLEEVKGECDHLLEGYYHNQILQHCHLENHTD